MKTIAALLKRKCKWLYLFVMLCYEKGKNIWIELRSYARLLHIGRDNYKKLKALKNAYAGERCFIIATGPSLRAEDLKALENEVTFGMNSLCMLYDQMDWRASYIGVQDRRVFEKIEPYLEKYCKDNVLISDDICKEFDKRKEWIFFPYNGSYHAYDTMLRNKLWAKFSKNCHHMVYDGYTITYSLLEIACYMGFKEIYLLGADCNYQEGQKNHFVEAGVRESSYEYIQDKLFCGYRKAKEFADKQGIKIYNATRGGMLEVFPRVDFDSIALK